MGNKTGSIEEDVPQAQEDRANKENKNEFFNIFS